MWSPSKTLTGPLPPLVLRPPALAKCLKLELILLKFQNVAAPTLRTATPNTQTSVHDVPSFLTWNTAF